MIKINRYYSGTDGDMNAKPIWSCNDFLDFCKQTEGKYKDMKFRCFKYDGESCVYVKDTNKYRTFLQKHIIDETYNTYFFINADTKEEIEQFLKDANVSIVEK